MTLLKSAATVGGLTLVSRAAGFIRDMLTASVLGTGPVQQRRRIYAVMPLVTEVVETDPVLKQNYQSLQVNVRRRFDIFWPSTVRWPCTNTAVGLR